MKNDYFEKIIFAIGISVIIICVFFYKNTVEEEDTVEKNKTETNLYTIDLKAVNSIEVYPLSGSSKLVLEDTKSIESMLTSIKSSTYGNASHPTFEKADDIYINIIDNSNHSLFLLYCIIMKEGQDNNVVYYNVENKPTHKYKSNELYSFLVSHKVYDESKRKFIITP